MKVQCIATPAGADSVQFSHAAVAVIDVLRATSSIIAMLESGAKQVIPVADIETASRLVDSVDHGIKLLAGERKGRNIEGFDFGNSPSEFTRGAVGGKTVIFTTSNGTQAIIAASKAARLIVCSINNVGAVAEAVAAENRLVILCSGAYGRLASEDLLCAGILIKRFMGRIEMDPLDDTGRIALLLAERHGGDIEKFLRACTRGRELISLGFEADLSTCARLDVSLLVPETRQGVITA